MDEGGVSQTVVPDPLEELGLEPLDVFAAADEDPLTFGFSDSEQSSDNDFMAREAANYVQAISDFDAASAPAVVAPLAEPEQAEQAVAMEVNTPSHADEYAAWLLNLPPGAPIPPPFGGGIAPSAAAGALGLPHPADPDAEAPKPAQLPAQLPSQKSSWPAASQAESTEVISATDPTPESAQHLEFQLDEWAEASSPETISDPLTDSHFGRAVNDFAGSALGSLVEQADEAPGVLATEPVQNSLPPVETPGVTVAEAPAVETMTVMPPAVEVAPPEVITAGPVLADSAMTVSEDLHADHWHPAADPPPAQPHESDAPSMEWTGDAVVDSALAFLAHVDDAGESDERLGDFVEVPAMDSNTPAAHRPPEAPSAPVEEPPSFVASDSSATEPATAVDPIPLPAEFETRLPVSEPEAFDNNVPGDPSPTVIDTDAAMIAPEPPFIKEDSRPEPEFSILPQLAADPFAEAVEPEAAPVTAIAQPEHSSDNGLILPEAFSPEATSPEATSPEAPLPEASLPEASLPEESVPKAAGALVAPNEEDLGLDFEAEAEIFDDSPFEDMAFGDISRPVSDEATEWPFDQAAGDAVMIEPSITASEELTPHTDASEADATTPGAAHPATERTLAAPVGAIPDLEPSASEAATAETPKSYALPRTIPSDFVSPPLEPAHPIVAQAPEAMPDTPSAPASAAIPVESPRRT